jgi:hypothetical protein
MDHNLLEGDERVLWGCLALMRIARKVEGKSGAVGAIAYISVLLGATMDSVVAKGIITDDEIAQVLGHHSKAEAMAKVDGVIEKLSLEEAVEAMEVWDAIGRLEPDE